MKPVNFIDQQKQVKEKANKFNYLLLIPVIFLVLAILFDYANLKTQIRRLERESVTYDNSLEEKLNFLKASNNEAEKQKNFYEKMKIKKTKEEELKKALLILNRETNNNIFFSEISFSENNFSILGNSSNKSNIQNLNQCIKTSELNLNLEEISLENNYYRFRYGSDQNENN